MQTLEIDIRVLEGDDEVKRVFLVAQKQVFGVPSRDLPAQILRLLDGEQRRVLDR